MSDDPLDDVDPDDFADREGDPFESLDAPEDEDAPDASGVDDVDDAERTGSGAPDAGGPPTDDPFEYLGDRSSGGSADETGDTESPSDRPDSPVDVSADPFGDVDVSRGDPFESAENPFERVDVDGVDPDDLWAELTADESERTAGVDPPEDDVVEVSKHRFCEGCPHFSPPPEVSCSHDTAAIIEFVGPDDVRIKNCPIVQERRELGEVHE